MAACDKGSHANPCDDMDQGMFDATEDDAERLQREIHMLESRLAHTKDLLKTQKVMGGVTNSGMDMQKVMGISGSSMASVATAVTPRSANGVTLQPLSFVPLVGSLPGAGGLTAQPPSRPRTVGAAPAPRGRHLAGQLTAEEQPLFPAPAGLKGSAEEQQMLLAGPESQSLRKQSQDLSAQSQTSRLLLSRDVAVHRRRWNVLHRCQKIFQVADDLWRLADEYRRSLQEEPWMRETVAETRLRELRDKLVKMAEEVYSDGSNPSPRSFETVATQEKLRVKRKLAAYEEKISVLELTISTYFGGKEQVKERDAWMREQVVGSRLDLWRNMFLIHTFALWFKDVCERRHKKIRRRIPVHAAPLADRFILESQWALVDTVFRIWLQEAWREGLDRLRKENKEMLAKARLQKLQAAQLAFDGLEEVLKTSSFRAWKDETRDAKLHKGRREALKKKMAEEMASSGIMLVRQIVMAWGTMILTNRARRAGKESLIKQVLNNLANSERAVFQSSFREWSIYTMQETRTRKEEEARVKEMNAKLAKMQAFEQMFKQAQDAIFDACWRSWTEETDIARKERKFKQNGMDATLRRILGQNQQILVECLQDWIAHYKECVAEVKRKNIEDARLKALAYFLKSLDKNTTELQKGVVKAWREIVDMQLTRMRRRQALLERVGREMASTEMIVALLLPVWRKLAAEGADKDRRDAEVKSTLEKARKIIIKLRDATILRVNMVAWYARACV